MMFSFLMPCFTRKRTAPSYNSSVTSGCHSETAIPILIEPEFLSRSFLEEDFFKEEDMRRIILQFRLSFLRVKYIFLYRALRGIQDNPSSAARKPGWLLCIYSAFRKVWQLSSNK